MKLLDLVEVPRERRDRVGDAQERQREGVALALVRRERARTAGDDRTRQQFRVAKCVGDAVSSQWVLEIARIAHERPTRSLAVAQMGRCSTKASQAADQGAAFDVGTQLGTGRLQDLEKAAPDVVAKCRGEPRSRNRRKDAVTAIRRDHPRRDILSEVPMEAITTQVFDVAKGEAR